MSESSLLLPGIPFQLNELLVIITFFSDSNPSLTHSLLTRVGFERYYSANELPCWTLVILCSYSTSVFLQFRQCQAALHVGLETLKRMMKTKDAGAPQTAPGPRMAV